MRPSLALALVAALSTPALAQSDRGVASDSVVVAVHDGTRPDDALTPGEIRTTDRDEICSTRTGSVRNVSVTTKIAARRAYGLINRDGWCAAGHGCDLEIDHRVPLVVGGGNTPGSIRNLWPEKGEGPNNYHDKDRCEAAAGRAICDGTLSVADAQAMFLGDWVSSCAAFMGSR